LSATSIPNAARGEARRLPRLDAIGPILVGGDAGPAQGIGERATRRGLISAQRWGARAVIGASDRSAGAAGIVADLVVETQRQRNSLACLIHVQDLDQHDVAERRAWFLFEATRTT
jgi:hypothetical protein